MPLVSSIAIDGPAGSGKSTISKMLSEATGLPYLSTGEMYRAVALCVLRSKLDPQKAGEVLDCARKAEISAKPDGRGGFKILCGEEDVTGQLRSKLVSDMSSAIAVHKGVRRLMVKLQRAIAVDNDVIMDGRDIGTVVLKESRRKVFLEASPEERARRRLCDYAGKGRSYEQVLNELKERDARDSSRKADPLRPAEGALIIDTTNLNPAEVIDRILASFGQCLRGERRAE